ncbi:MAG: protein kinase [Legionella sp.]
MPHIVIDPKLFTEESTNCIEAKVLLQRLLFSNNSHRYTSGIHQLDADTTIILTNPLVVRLRESNLMRYRVEVLSKQSLFEGSYGNIVESLGVLVPERNLAFKHKPVEKSRICKFIPYRRYVSTGFTIFKEACYTKRNQYLHAKGMIPDGNGGIIVMRHIKGISLNEFIVGLNKQIFAISVIVRLKLTYDIILALKQQVHDLGLVHNDIKPENIQMDSIRSSIVVIDYGFAKEKTEQNPHMIGTVPYISPECINSIQTNAKSDIYSLGLVLARFWGDKSIDSVPNPGTIDDADHYHKTRHFNGLFDGIDLNPVLKTEIQALLEGFLKYNPEERISLEAALARLEHFLLAATEKLQAENVTISTDEPQEHSNSTSSMTKMF